MSQKNETSFRTRFGISNLVVVSKKVLPLLSILFLFTVFFSSCKEEKANTKKTIVCTTGIIADLVRNLVADSIEIEALMGVGVDPHLYKPSAKDLKALQNADLIVGNGLHLEGKMVEVLGKLSATKNVILLGDSLPESLLIKTDAFANGHDPHIWFSTSIWNICANTFANNYMALAWEEQTEVVNRLAAYSDKLNALADSVRIILNTIPEKRRVLVTAHDAFGYYSKEFGIEIKALQGISTQAEFGVKDVMGLAKFVSDRQIPAIFVETSIPVKSIEAVVEACKANKHQVKIGEALYSDALGAKDSKAGTYLGMVLENTKHIMEGLK